MNVPEGTPVMVVQKEHQRTGQLTEGVVDRILTKSPWHPRGIKVMLSSGIVGRVQQIQLLEQDQQAEQDQQEAGGGLPVRIHLNEYTWYWVSEPR